MLNSFYLFIKYYIDFNWYFSYNNAINIDLIVNIGHILFVHITDIITMLQKK